MSPHRPLITLLMLFVAPLTLAVSASGLEVEHPAASGLAEGSGRTWVWPLAPTPSVVKTFDPAEQRWLAGHRGVDLAGETGQLVFAIGDGEVTFASNIAGRGVVVVTHGALRSTYEPVTADVRVGRSVHAGQRIGSLQAPGSHCAPSVCLHLGLRRGDVYLDPLSLFGPLAVRLKPIGPGAGSVTAGQGFRLPPGPSHAGPPSKPRGTRGLPQHQLPPASPEGAAADTERSAAEGSDTEPVLVGVGAAGAALATTIAVTRRRQARG